MQLGVLSWHVDMNHKEFIYFLFLHAVFGIKYMQSSSSTQRGRKRLASADKDEEKENNIMDVSLEEEDINKEEYMRPARKKTKEDRAKATCDPMVCLIDLTSLESESGKLPFLVHVTEMLL